MPIDVRVLRTDETVTVSLTGPLTLERVPEVRALLLECLAECPTCLIVDLSGMTVDSDLPLVVFPTVARHARTWPGAPPMVLCAPPGPVADRFPRWQRRLLPIHHSRAEALAALAMPDETPPALRVELPPGPQAQARVRWLICAACVDWNLPHLCTAAELVVSELTGNAVRHGAPPILLVAAARQRYLHIVARDANPQPPRRLDWPASRALPVAGYGLRLVDAIATAWGCLQTAGGKAVWATIRRDAATWPPGLIARYPQLAGA
jgi:anti-anti-sigma regulatory factor